LKLRWYHGWSIVAVCILAGIAASALPVNAYSLFLHDWSTLYAVPVSTLHIGFAAFGVGCSLIAPLIGMLADRYPIRRMFVLGLVTLIAFSVSLSLATRVWQYFTLFAVILPFAVTATTSLPANVLIARWFVRRRGLALSLTAVGLGLGGVVMPPIVASTLATLGWQTIWRLGAIVTALVVLPLVLLVLRERPVAADGTRYLSDDAAVGHEPADTSLRWRDILTRRIFWLLVIVYLPMLASYIGCAGNLAPIVASRGLDPRVAGTFLSLLSLAQLAATLAGGLLSDRFGNRWPLAGLAAVTACGSALVALGHSTLSLGIGFLLVGAGASFWPLIASAIAVEFGAGAVGRVFGMVSFFLPFAVWSAYIVARTQEATGSYAPALLTITSLALAGGASCLLWLREKVAVPLPATAT
jgi:MFS family permease